MWATELDSFVGKFHQLWRTGASAHLDFECHAGQAWVGIRVQLGYPPGHVQNYHQYDRRQCARHTRGPSYQRRQERRRLAAEEAAAEKTAAEEAAAEKAVAEKAAADKVAADNAEKQEEGHEKEVAAEKPVSELSAEKHSDENHGDGDKEAKKWA